ncbi:MAG: Gfo/Idh/MocA family oxidoreductase [Alphaproteobacteria bacterium]|nr:Gfo/Idh/MocA family oxidoreductase [Alphaproteobacteria bacterium]
MAQIGIGIVGGGYMGKAHAVAMAAVGAVFDTVLRPTLEMICTTSEAGAAEKARQFGFKRSTSDWRKLVEDPAVGAVIIASPQETHHDIALAALGKGKHVLCEKPLGLNAAQSRAMVAAAEQSGCVHMAGFNYIRTPATQLARQIIAQGEIGRITFLRAEHTEDFLADASQPGDWRTQGRANGTMGDLAPHIINAALALGGPITSLVADIATVHQTRGGVTVSNDDQSGLLCRFASGAMGQLFVSRVATGRKMGYAYEVYGTKGSLRFDQEDQNALWLYRAEGPEARRGFTKILTGPLHPDYKAFCLGPGHGTGYQDQIIIEARDFLQAIHEGQPRWPSFRDGLMVDQIIEAGWKSHEGRCWVNIENV